MFKLQPMPCIALLLLLLLLTSQEVSCHTKGLKPSRPQPAAPGGRYPANLTQTQLIERQFTRWVRFVGRLRHSAFSVAKNKVFPSYALVVDKNPSKGDFTTIQAAVDSIPPINLVRVVIKVNAGIYTEKVNISPLRAFISIEGAGADRTMVQWGDTAQTIGSNGQPIGTFNSATFAVNSPYFIAKNITFKNTTPVPPPGAAGKQAVALRISGDTATFLGWVSCPRNSSKLRSIDRTEQDEPLDDTGFSFVNCKVTGSGALYLGRAWGTFSRVVFAYTWMDNIIIPTGWYNWGDPNREMTVFYGQYRCTGPGSTKSGRVSWSRELTDEEAKPFISMTFIDGSEWIKIGGVDIIHLIYFPRTKSEFNTPKASDILTRP
ncbi:putative pectinesterase 53 [Acorus calamus]|uniref:pectinesterase n=1 Tax=Acorus calamus TaxID=4465 RepID=A0AAV9CMF7_ACOCL|nr:putative pectinesterase 53 [Acorus calamus]